MSVAHDTRRAATFSALPTIDGYDVVDDTTGRPVDHRETRLSANGVAQRLNRASLYGPDALSVALGSSYPKRARAF